MENAHSSGGVVTVEDLVIKKGYWRATATSTSVLECYNGNACLGGFTTGSCAEGYEGPCKCFVEASFLKFRFRVDWLSLAALRRRARLL